MSSYFGLDLGSSSIKVVQAELLGTKGFRVKNIGLAQNAAGSVNFGDPSLTGKLAQSVKQVISESGIRDKRAVISIPETQAYSRIVEMPNMTDTELSTAINWEAEQFVPVPVKEVEIDYAVIKRPPKGSDQKMLVYLVAAPKTYLQSLVDFVLSLGIEPVAVESEMVAVARAFSFGMAQGTSLLVHIGATNIVMAVIQNENLLFTHVSNTGGTAMTRAIAQSLQLPLAQAEEYKRTYGLDGSQLEGKVKQSLMIVIDSIMSDMKKAMEHIGTKYATNITRIYISGGGAYMPGMTQYFSGIFGGLEVLIGDPFMYAKPSSGVSIPNERAVYSVAAGLSIRSA